MNTKLIALSLLSAFAASPLAVAAEGEVDNGTDPTKLSSSASIAFEHLDLVGGFGSDTLKLSYTMPFGEKKDFNVQFKLPVASISGIGNGGYDIGDASVKITHVFGVNAKRGLVLQGEMVFDTAGRDELGTGQNVFKGTFTYAKFLEGGAIFAPTIVQSNSLWGDDDRADVNNTTLDFYYVPKLSNPKNLVTLDPSISFDWENNREFAGLAVTFGRILGPMLGGNGILSVKPSIYGGSERPSDWGVEVNFKVIGF